MKAFRKILIHLAADLLVVLLILAGLGYAFMEKFLFPSPHTGVMTGNILLTSGDEVLDAFWQRGEKGKPVILYSHGNGEYLATIRHRLDDFLQHGCSVLAYDYAGYGGSTGTAGEKQSYRDIDAAYRFLTEEQKIPPQEILFVGFSVGCGPSCYAAEKYPCMGLVLCAPFASAIQVIFPFSLPFDRFPNAKRLSKIEAPTLIFHGKLDKVIPYRNSVVNYRMSAGIPKDLISEPTCGHNDLFIVLEDRFWEHIAEFFEITDSEKSL